MPKRNARRNVRAARQRQLRALAWLIATATAFIATQPATGATQRRIGLLLAATLAATLYATRHNFKGRKRK